jgi:hypothetical protein
MPVHLKNYSSPPPGLYSYYQSEGLTQSFQASPVIEEVVKRVSAFRLKNKLPRGSLAECLHDVEQYTCARLRNHPDWCFESPTEFEKIRESHPFVKKTCSSCGKPPLN